MPDTEVKKDKGKRRLDLLPWDAIDEVGNVLTYGINKYPEPKENWRQNSTIEDIPRYKAALLRHFSAIEQGEERDSESGELHMAHIATNALFIIALEKSFTKPKTTNAEKQLEMLNAYGSGQNFSNFPSNHSIAGDE